MNTDTFYNTTPIIRVNKYPDQQQKLKTTFSKDIKVIMFLLSEQNSLCKKKYFNHNKSIHATEHNNF